MGLFDIQKKKVKNGIYTESYKSGNLYSNLNYKDGELDGKCIWYYDENERVKCEGNYKDGEEDGKWIWY